MNGGDFLDSYADRENDILDVIARKRPFTFSGMDFIQFYTESEQPVDKYGKAIKNFIVPDVEPYHSWSVGDPVTVKYDKTKKAYYPVTYNM